MSHRRIGGRAETPRCGQGWTAGLYSGARGSRWKAEAGLGGQAAGMLTEQLGTRIAEALLRLRAYAYAHDRGLWPAISWRAGCI